MKHLMYLFFFMIDANVREEHSPTHLIVWSVCVEAPGMVSTLSVGEASTLSVVLRSMSADCFTEKAIISLGISGVSPSASSVNRWAANTADSEVHGPLGSYLSLINCYQHRGNTIVK